MDSDQRHDGLVLVPGGLTTPHTNIASTDLFDPKTGTWTTGRAMSEPRSGHSTVVLRGNRGAMTMGGLDNGPQRRPASISARPNNR